MSIEEIKMFRCSDGATYESHKDAINHENRNTLWDKAMADYSRYDEVVFAYQSDFVEFLENNKELLRQMFKLD